VYCLCEFYPSNCLTTEEKARKNLSQVKENLRQSRKTSVRIHVSSLKTDAFDKVILKIP